MKALETVVGKYSGKKVMIVSHGAVINSVLFEISRGSSVPEKQF
jgi:broad specificity phosphatase PhoE